MTVYLVGAGPGDPGLLTVRGDEVLRRADVVVYDRLSVESLLTLAPAAAERISVGKAPGRVTMGQEDINALLVEKGRQHETVVRLKGGDPFVFARGGEEAEALAASHGRVYREESWLDFHRRNLHAPYGGRKRSGWVWEWHEGRFRHREGLRTNALEFSRPTARA